MSTNIPLSEIVSVQLRLDAFPVSRTGFGTPLFIGPSDPAPAQAAKVATFTSLAEVAVVYDVAEPEYLAAAAYFGQNPKPTRLKIGYKAAGETYPVALAAIRALDDDWFFLTAATRLVAEQTALAVAVNGIAGYRQAHFVSNDTATVMNNALATDIGSVLKTNSYLTCFAHYHQTATAYPEMALLGRVAVDRDTTARIPGSVNVDKTAVSGISASVLTPVNRVTLETKRYTFFQSLSQLTRAFNGRSGQDVPFDIVYFMGWLSARLPESVTETLTRANDRGEKVPYNAMGIAQIESAMAQVLNIGVNAGAIEPGYVLSLPERADVAFADRVARILNNVTFSANLTGAIEAVNVNGLLIA